MIDWDRLLWERWFAWYPVRVAGQLTWLRWVERQQYFPGDANPFEARIFSYRLPRPE